MDPTASAIAGWVTPAWASMPVSTVDISSTRNAESARWTVRWHRAPGARLRLFCLPHTGGGAAAYRSWADRLAPDIEVVAIRLPGRESRLRETPYTRHDQLVAALVGALQPWLDRPHAWFGHSMGALIAFEACRAMRRLNLAEPMRLVVSGHPAPHLPTRDLPAIDDANAAELMSWLHRLSATPKEVLDDPAVLSLMLPTVRADLAVGESYRFRAESPLDCPISVFGGADDPFATVEELHAWREHSLVGCTVRTLPGGHFFLHEEREAVIRDIAADLA